MLPFKRILFPVDYSDRCRSVVPYVNDMVEHFSASLAVVHAHGVDAEFREVRRDLLRLGVLH